MPNNNPHKRTYGQYFTPGPVVHCCYDLLAGYVPANPRIADPACGDGAFLKAAWERGIAAPPALRGCDLDAALVEALHREGLAGVYCADGLDAASLPAATFDLVAGNPPFGVATSPGKHQIASEVRFLLRALDLARPGGYVALVLPNGIFANERLQTLRAELLARLLHVRAHDAIGVPKLVECSNCHQPMLPHRVCPNCGQYRGRQVLDVSEPTKPA